MSQQAVAFAGNPLAVVLDPVFGLSLVFQLFGLSLVKLEDVLAGEKAS
jgi:hypothetical protein